MIVTATFCISCELQTGTQITKKLLISQHWAAGNIVSVLITEIKALVEM